MTATHREAEKPQKHSVFKRVTGHEPTPEELAAKEKKAAEDKAAADAKAAEEAEAAKAKAFAEETAKPPSKAWVRKEMDLRASGHTLAEREQLNP